MPRLDGMGLLRRVCEKSANPPEIIMLTGQGTVETAIESMKLGAYDYLTKPYRIAELSALVTRPQKNISSRKTIRDSAHRSLEVRTTCRRSSPNQRR
jgi:DNA-binding response OmpR family regulator